MSTTSQIDFATTMTDVCGNPLRTVNAHPAPTAAQIAEAEELEARAAKWNRREGVCDENAGGAYELSQIVSGMHREAMRLRNGGHVLVMALWDKVEGKLCGRPIPTRYGHAYKVRNGWINTTASDRTLARRGYEWVGAWIPADKE